MSDKIAGQAPQSGGRSSQTHSKDSQFPRIVFLSRASMEELGRTIESVAGVKSSPVKLMALAVQDGKILPCVAAPKPTVLAIAVGENFFKAAIRRCITLSDPAEPLR